MPTQDDAAAVWHILDVDSIWVKEFASALSSFVPTIGWSPVRSWTGMFQSWVRDEELTDPPVRVAHFPLQRGYHRFPISDLCRLGFRQRERMSQLSASPAVSPLVCTTPYYAPVAEKWDGPVIYYQTDLTVEYAGVNQDAIRRLDRRLCRVAAAVCPNSRRIGDYMVRVAGCDPEKIVVVPNATRRTNISICPPSGPAPLPDDLSDLPRPIAGVIGNLAGNLNWSLLQAAVAMTPEFRWVFVGPFEMAIPDASERAARRFLLEHGGQVRFVGAKSYGALQQYARAIDVAVLPYRRKEPTFSGSSTRFYEHLAACRPMIATRGFEELLHKEPLLRLVDTAAEIAQGLNELREQNFEDGFAAHRWSESQRGTWHDRAISVIDALQSRWVEKPLHIVKDVDDGHSFLPATTESLCGQPFSRNQCD